MSSLGFSINIITTLTVTLAWLMIGVFTYRIYKKQPVKPKVWKVAIVVVIGISSFSFNWNLENGLARLPILPLGVWILYGFLRRKEGRWKSYRAFAWLGFWANFLFLAASLLAIPIHQVVYPPNEPSTYLAGIENASIIYTHPSAIDRSLSKGKLPLLTQENIYSDQWYMDTYMNTEATEKKERFPYQLVGTTAKWGSGLDTLVFIEDDGMGILIATPKKQLYFRSTDSLLGGGE